MPGGKVESVTWDDLQTVLAMTNDSGPLAEDFFLVLIGASGRGCLVPGEAEGFKNLLARLQRLPNFDNEMFAQACCSTSNERFLCWWRAP